MTKIKTKTLLRGVKRGVQINIRVSPETADRIRDHAQQEGESMGVLVEKAIMKYLDGSK